MESSPQGVLLQTSITSKILLGLRKEVEQHVDIFNSSTKVRLQKLSNVARKTFAKRAFLLDENRLLLSRTTRAVVRESVKSIVVDKAKVISYDDIVEAKIKRETKDEGEVGTKRDFTWKNSAFASIAAKKSRKDKVGKTRREIEASILGDYYFVPQF